MYSNVHERVYIHRSISIGAIRYNVVQDQVKFNQIQRIIEAKVDNIDIVLIDSDSCMLNYTYRFVNGSASSRNSLETVVSWLLLKSL